MPSELLLALSVEHSVRHWLFRLGGVGLIALGLADNSVVPLPGSLDAFTILLAAWLGRTDGTQILGFFRQYYKPVLYGLIGLAVVGGVGALIYYKQWRKTHPPKRSQFPTDKQKVA